MGGMGRGKGMRGNGEAVESTAVADARLPWVLRPSDISAAAQEINRIKPMIKMGVVTNLWKS